MTSGNRKPDPRLTSPWSSTWADFCFEWRSSTTLGRGLVVAELLLTCIRLVGSALPTGGAPFQDMRQDVANAWRRLRRAPGFLMVAVATLGLGIGATTTIFSLVNGLLLRPIPGVDSSALVGIARHQDNGNTRLSQFDVADLRRYGADVFSSVAAAKSVQAALTGPTRTDRVAGELVSVDYFKALRIHPLVGRLFNDGDAAPGVAVAVISESLWRRVFGAEPNAIGTTVELDRTKLTIVGVVPDAFHGTLLPTLIRSDIWTPDTALQQVQSAVRGVNEMRGWTALVDVTPGIPGARVQAVLDRIASDLNERAGATRVRFAQTSPAEVITPGDFSSMGLAIGSAVLGLSALVLLIACANVTNLFLARGAARSPEVALRLALGAGPFRIFRLFGAEVALVVGAASVVGWCVAYGGSRVLSALPLPELEGIRLAPAWGSVSDVHVFGYTFLAAAVAALASGWIPAVRASRLDPSRVLAAGSPMGGLSPRHTRLRRALVAIQVGVCVVLLVVSALFTRSSWASLTHDPGFDASRAATAAMTIDPRRMEVGARGRYFERVLNAASEMPGVRSAALYDVLPIGPRNNRDSVTVGRPRSPFDTSDADSRWERSVRYSLVTEHFFDIVRLPIIRGRAIASSDTPGTPLVTVVNQRLADRLWPGQDPIGQQLSLDRKLISPTVVGVVGNTDVGWPNQNWRALPENYLFLSATQMAEDTTTMSVMISGDAEPGTLVAPLEAAVRAVDPGVAVSDVSTLARQAGVWLLPIRLSGGVLATLGVVGWAIALVGVYGVVAYLVSLRTREIGVRMALGASASDVRWIVLRDAMRMMLAGVVPGVLVALGGGFLLRHVLFGVSPHDPLTYVAVPFVLVAVGLLATWMPARRAARIDPNVALRQQ